MPLSDYKQKFQKVEFDGGDFTVRGITLPDVALLIEFHESAISTIVAMAQSRSEAFGSGNPETVQEAITDMITSLTRESPILMANMIAICAEEEGEMHTALKLPITVQLDAMTKIAGLTFKDLASVKKLAADVMSLIHGIVPPATARRTKK